MCKFGQYSNTVNIMNHSVVIEDRARSWCVHIWILVKTFEISDHNDRTTFYDFYQNVTPSLRDTQLFVVFEVS